MVLALIALFVATAQQSDFPDEQSLANGCGTRVLSHARIQEVHGDSHLLIYDDRLPSAQVNCLLDWAASLQGKVINGVRTYASHRYPLGPYDIPPELNSH